MSVWDSIAAFFSQLFKKSPTPLPAPAAPPGVSLVRMAFVPDVANYYSPCSIDDGTTYNKWVTNGDRIARYQSRDGVNWTNGKIVMTAIPKSWEDDLGGIFLGSQTGLSDPRVLRDVTPGWKYTQYYTGGHAPNTETSGGVGCAVSQNGDDWQRVGSGILRRFPGGNCFVIQAMTIRDKRYWYYLGGGDASKGEGPKLWVADDAGNGINFTNDRILDKLPGTYIPLFYDAAADSCWSAVGSSATTPAGPVGFDIYRGGDGFTTLGEKIATVDSKITGNAANFDPEALQRDGKGMRSRTGPVQILFSSGNQWGTWRPASVIINL